MKENYTGHELDDETGLLYAGSRYYDPVIARWMVVDPQAARYPSWSPYNYVFNTPLIWTDPDGECPTCWEFTKGYFRGYYRALGSSISGTWNAVTHPVRTAKGVYSAAVNYEETAAGIVDAGKAKLDQLQNGDAGARGEVVGEAVEFLVETVATAGAAGATAKGARTARALDNVSGAAGATRSTALVPLKDVPIGQLFAGRTPAASEIVAWAEAQGFSLTQTATGPMKFVDANGVVRVTVKRGSSRAPGSGNPHVELRDASGQRIDPMGNAVTRKSPGNHTPIEWDLEN